MNRRTVIGYVPKLLAHELSKVLDMGIPVKARLLQIIGGYRYKETLGACKGYKEAVNILTDETFSLEEGDFVLETCLKPEEVRIYMLNRE